MHRCSVTVVIYINQKHIFLGNYTLHDYIYYRVWYRLIFHSNTIRWNSSTSHLFHLDVQIFHLSVFKTCNEKECFSPMRLSKLLWFHSRIQSQNHQNPWSYSKAELIVSSLKPPYSSEKKDPLLSEGSEGSHFLQDWKWWPVPPDISPCQILSLSSHQVKPKILLPIYHLKIMFLWYTCCRACLNILFP